MSFSGLAWACKLVPSEDMETTWHAWLLASTF